MVYATEEYLLFFNDSQSLFIYLSKHSGKTCTTRADCLSICDTIVTEVDSKLLVDKWATDIYPTCVQFIADSLSYWIGFGTSSNTGTNFRTEIPKIKGGPLLWEIIDRMQDKYENFVDPTKNDYLTDLKYYVYSGEDTILTALSTVLDFEHIDFDRDLSPGTSDAISFELWINDNNEPFVKVLHWRKDELTYIDLSTKITGCKYSRVGCSLQNFATRSEKYRPPENLSLICQADPG